MQWSERKARAWLAGEALAGDPLATATLHLTPHRWRAGRRLQGNAIPRQMRSAPRTPPICEQLAAALDELAASNDLLSAVLLYEFRTGTPHGVPRLLSYPAGVREAMSASNALSAWLLPRCLDRFQLAVLCKLYKVVLPEELRPIRVFGPSLDRIAREGRRAQHTVGAA